MNAKLIQSLDNKQVLTIDPNREHSLQLNEMFARHPDNSLVIGSEGLIPS